VNRTHPIIASMTLAAAVTATSLLGDVPTAIAGSQSDIAGPAGSGAFGNPALVLSNGNFVIADPTFDKAGVVDVGAVYLYSGATRQLISTLTGSFTQDRVGEHVDEVGDSNFVVRSTSWSNPNPGAYSAGAVTWVSGTAGLSGVVSPANSLVGSTDNDAVGAQFELLSNGNYVIGSPTFDSAGVVDAGAATWGFGNGPTAGAVGAANSLVGLSAADGVGGMITPLTNGNYVVTAPLFDDLFFTATDGGAATWANGSDVGPRTTGPLSSGKSLRGMVSTNQVGGGGILALTNGNYVVLSPAWDLNAMTPNAGAATLADGATGSSGFVLQNNSLHGTTANDAIGDSDSVALANGNYVIASRLWDDTGAGHTDVGAVTWRPGATSFALTSGIVSEPISLYGTVNGDQVSGGGITALTNGNYVVQSPALHRNGQANAGAATWASGTTGLTGAVSSANSLVGFIANDLVGDHVTPLTNGNYVVQSVEWDNGAVVDAGAATWGSGAGGLVGSVTPSNSLVGSTASDGVGEVVQPLTNGNYVVASAGWNSERGAATWGNGATGVTGAITEANSLVGDVVEDLVGVSGVLALPTGDYVVLSPGWARGPLGDAGAATFASGSTGIFGHITPANSLVGASAANQVGGFAFALPDGAYMVASHTKSIQPGAVTFVLPTGAHGELNPVATVFGTAPMSVPLPQPPYTADGSVLVSRDASNLVTLYRPDRTAPVFGPAADVTVVAAPGATTADVSYAPPVAAEDVGPAPVVTCSPPPGSAFPVGATTVTCTATNTEGITATTSFTVHVVDDYVPLTPARVADSRPGGVTVDGLFAGKGLRSADSTLQLDVAGRGGVPVDAPAVTLNVTVTEAAADGFLTVYPCDQARPTASNLNYSSGSTIPNAVVTKLAATDASKGAVCVYVQQAAHVVVDVNGYFPPTTTYDPINPARVIDTRAGSTTVDGQQAGAGAAAAGSVTTVSITGRAGVPADAAAVVLNVTVTEPAAAGFATVFPCGTQPPTASNLNYTPGLTIPNLVVAKIGAGGAVCVFTQSPTHLIADVLGYFPPATSYHALVPARLSDSRPGAATVDGTFAGSGLVPLGSVTVVHVLGRGGVPANASTAVLNVTVTEPAAPGFVVVYPCGIQPPLASNLNFVAGQTIPNAVLTKIGNGGDVCIFNSQPTHLITDVAGYFP